MKKRGRKKSGFERTYEGRVDVSLEQRNPGVALVSRFAILVAL